MAFWGFRQQFLRTSSELYLPAYNENASRADYAVLGTVFRYDSMSFDIQRRRE